jgi:large subunit ribosomal protein L25
VGEYALEVELREGTGKGVARKLRAVGRIPATLYGRGQGATSVSLVAEALEQLLHESDAGLNTLIDVRVPGQEGEPRVVLVKEFQRDPLLGALLHVDLYQVDLAATVEVEVPIHLTGRPRGVELSDGILDHSLRELLIECLPRAIPESIEVNVAELEIGDTIHVRDLVLPEGVELRSDADLSVASVVAAKVIEEEAPAEALAEGEVAPAEPGAEGEAAPSDADKKEGEGSD